MAQHGPDAQPAVPRDVDSAPAGGADGRADGRDAGDSLDAESDRLFDELVLDSTCSTPRAPPPADDLQLALVYNADLFSEDRMSALLADIADVLDFAVRTPDAPLDARPDRVPSVDEHHVALALRHAGCAQEARSIPERLAQIAAQSPGLTAVVGTDRDITYAELHRDVQRIARLVSAATAADRSQVIGVFVPHDEHAVQALLGALASGCAYVPLDPDYPEARLRLMVDDAGVKTIVSTAALRGRATELLSHGGTVVDVASPVGEEVPLPELPSAHAVAYLLYTSGSSGRPKAVVQSHGNLLVQATRFRDALSLGPGDRLAWLASISFDASIMDVYDSIVAGAALCPIDARALDLATLPSRLVERRLNILHVTPTVLRALARVAEATSMEGVRALVLGGEPVRADDVAFFDASFPAEAILFNLYGASEHSFALGAVIDRHHRSLEVPIGWPVGDTEVLLLGEDGHPDPVRGELALRSAFGALHYWNAPTENARAFAQDPEHEDRTVYRTGDRVRRRPDGAYVHLGRIDHQVKIRGHRVEVAEVEAVLRTHPGVRDVAVYAPNDATGDSVLAACVVGERDRPDSDPTALTHWLSERLPSYLVPTAWAVRDQLPRTPSGKVDRRSLPDVLPTDVRDDFGLTSWTADTQVILDIWREVLDLDSVNPEDSFFAIGGHSLTATQVVARVRDVFEVDLPLRYFFDHPTVTQLAAWVRDHQGSRTSMPPLVAGAQAERAALLLAGTTLVPAATRPHVDGIQHGCRRPDRWAARCAATASRHGSGGPASGKPAHALRDATWTTSAGGGRRTDPSLRNPRRGVARRRVRHRTARTCEDTRPVDHRARLRPRA